MVQVVTTIFLIFFLGICCGEQLSSLDFLHKPDSVNFKDVPSVSVLSSELPQLVDEFIGLSPSKLLGAGVSMDIWQRPEAVVLIQLESKAGIDLQGLPHFSIARDSEPEILTSFSNIAHVYPDGGYTLLDVSKDVSGTYRGTIPTVSAEDSETDLLKKELTISNSVLQWLQSRASHVANGVPDIYVFHYSGLDEISDSGESVSASGKIQLTAMINKIKDAFVEAYGGNLVVAVAHLQPLPHVRNPRADGDKPAADPAPRASTYKFYNDTYPVAFNIMLWFMIGFGLTIFGVGVWIWFMDPGKDSIIYRMTMTRAKKD